MNRIDFEKHLKTEKFDEVADVVKPVGYAMGEHQHTFDACALITAGEITLLVGKVPTRYGVGDIFRLSAGTRHHETAGPEGVSYMVGRRNVTVK
jgi:quercetin dioxygenase-like cupin family protein